MIVRKFHEKKLILPFSEEASISWCLCLCTNCLFPAAGEPIKILIINFVCSFRILGYIMYYNFKFGRGIHPLCSMPPNLLVERHIVLALSTCLTVCLTFSLLHQISWNYVGNDNKIFRCAYYQEFMMC